MAGDRIPLPAVGAVLAGLAAPSPAQVSLREASGVARLGHHLLLVSDEDPGAVYRYRFPAGERVMQLSGERLERVVWPWAVLGLDPEAIDVLADGRIVVLSERLRCLYDPGGVVAEYGKSLAQFAGVGLEGLAVRRLPDGSSEVAVLWEGGYADDDDAPKGIRKELRDEAFQPVVLVHRLSPGARAGTIQGEEADVYVRLQVPEPDGEEPKAQRFRAPDLVWEHVEGREPGFLVLLSSGNGKGDRFQHALLQRFDRDGRSRGLPFDLKRAVPESLREANWEGMDWFVPGASLVLVHDEPPGGDPHAVVVDLPAGWQ